MPMTPESLALAKRLTAASWWEWRAGMRACNPHQKAIGEHLIEDGDWDWIGPHSGIFWVPDLSDPATKGALLGVLREATEQPTVVWPYSDGKGWEATDFPGSLPCTAYAYGRTEEEALALALLEVLGE